MRRFHAPGRVNLIGDHIDYMGGTVLPMAIDRGTDLWIRPREDEKLVAVSDNFTEVGEVVADIDAQTPRAEWQWVNFLVGVVDAMRKRGVHVGGADVRVRGTIPHGAGLSSSASLEMAMAVAVNALAGAGLTPSELALVAQSAENDFIGVACGIMDQMAIATGVEGHALAVDCESLSVTPIPMPDSVAVVVADTKKRRELSSSAYNQRRAACEQAQERLGLRLVDVQADSLLTVLGELPPDLQPPARHVITEQQRVYDFAAALRADDRTELGRLMRASHESLRDDFEVTGPELDCLAQAAWSAPGVIGARMTGAGFGGCTVNLVEADAVAAFQEYVGDRYQQGTGLHSDFYEVQAAGGAREVST